MITIYTDGAAKGNPGWISTADLVAFLHTLDDRAWDEWNKSNVAPTWGQGKAKKDKQ